MSRLIASVMFLGIASLLVGARFGFVWAGGEGPVTSPEVKISTLEGRVLVDRAGDVRLVVAGSRVQRGEMIKTDEGGRVVLRIGFDTFVALDERSTLTLDRLTASEVSFNLESGRVLARVGQDTEMISITTDHTASWILKEAFTVVNYDFLETISIVPFNTVVNILVEPRDAFIATTATNVREVEPVQISDSTFNAAVVPFYAWTEKQTGYKLNQ